MTKETTLNILFNNKTTLAEFKKAVHTAADRLTEDMLGKIKSNSKQYKVLDK